PGPRRESRLGGRQFRLPVSRRGSCGESKWHVQTARRLTSRSSNRQILIPPSSAEVEMRARMLFLLVAALGLTGVLAGCGGSSKSSSTTTNSNAAGAAGGTFLSVAKGAPSGSPDPQINYTLQEWQL